MKRYRDHYPTYTSVLVAFELVIHRFKANLDRSILGLSIENIKTVRFYRFGLKKVCESLVTTTVKFQNRKIYRN